MCKTHHAGYLNNKLLAPVRLKGRTQKWGQNTDHRLRNVSVHSVLKRHLENIETAHLYTHTHTFFTDFHSLMRPSGLVIQILKEQFSSLGSRLNIWMKWIWNGLSSWTLYVSNDSWLHQDILRVLWVVTYVLWEPVTTDIHTEVMTLTLSDAWTLMNSSGGEDKNHWSWLFADIQNCTITRLLIPNSSNTGKRARKPFCLNAPLHRVGVTNVSPQNAAVDLIFIYVNCADPKMSGSQQTL